MAGDWAVTAEGLVKRFGERRVVDGVDLTVPAGSIYGVLGPNGAGKTTTLRMLLGIIEPDKGHRTLLGHAQPQDASDQVGYLPEERGLYPAMKAREAIAFMGALRGLDWRTGRARAGEMLEAAGLGHAADDPRRQQVTDPGPERRGPAALAGGCQWGDWGRRPRTTRGPTREALPHARHTRVSLAVAAHA